MCIGGSRGTEQTAACAFHSAPVRSRSAPGARTVLGTVRKDCSQGSSSVLDRGTQKGGRRRLPVGVWGRPAGRVPGGVSSPGADDGGSYRDSPLSRSPGSRVVSGVGLPITLLSSALGGPHRLLEYWGTPPHNSSLLPLPPRHGAFQWPASLRTRPWELPAALSRGWLDALLDCQLEVDGSAWP
ncbi:hypothetical protein P7K49_011908 [Saguinus oedipus]|uniref:Uncharacterized protein n=1 Tax=Saguinus oedipus TaxID=9490 RepID=A0ABQ9VSP8_SAGOE|nr:hypothetical protein P7K49_011908 [Saguinus oedipus]